MLQQLFSLQGQVALVTGGDKGLGQGLALALAQAGAKVAISSRSGSPDDTLQQIRDLGGEALAFRADQGDPNHAEALIEQVINGFGRIDILVNNAGTIRRANAAETEINDFREVIDINLTGIWALSQAAGRRMLEQYRLNAQLPRRHARPGLHRIKTRHRGAHQSACQRVGCAWP
jgi:2-deoxy-D-gluconate 3-dehydrogenase